MGIDDHSLYILLDIARRTVINYVKYRTTPSPSDFEYPEELNKKAGVFVTLEKESEKKPELRGCIGITYATKPLVEATIEAAVEACSSDPRFLPVKEEELPSLTIEVSVLTEPKEIDERSWQGKLDSITPYKDGIILKNGFYMALFLPQVWDQLPKKEQFLSYLSLKAGLPSHAWKFRETILYKFHVYSKKEKLLKENQ